MPTCVQGWSVSLPREGASGWTPTSSAGPSSCRGHGAHTALKGGALALPHRAVGWMLSDMASDTAMIYSSGFNSLVTEWWQGHDHGLGKSSWQGRLSVSKGPFGSRCLCSATSLFYNELKEGIIPVPQPKTGLKSFLSDTSKDRYAGSSWNHCVCFSICIM